VAFTFGFYNSINHDRRYDAVQVGQIFDGIINDGVYSAYKKAMLVKASDNDNQVIVQPGRAWFNHTWSYNDADLPVSMPGPETFYDRIDAVVLDINSANSSRVNSIQVVKGTPAANPSRPAMINETEHHQYPLAFVRRYGGNPKITQAEITNAVGSSACPFVTGLLQQITTDQIIAQWAAEFWAWNTQKQNEFLAWMNKQKADWQANIEHNTIAWYNWFQHIQTELDGDVAGHLQNQIDEIKKFAWVYVVDKTLFVPMSAATVRDKRITFTTV
jgi:hypothetical protein